MSNDAGQAASAAIERAETAATDAVRQAPDGHVGFRLAADLATAFHAAGDRVARLRGEAATRIHNDESLSLRNLARVVGVSKSRADQLMKEAAEHE